METEITAHSGVQIRSEVSEEEFGFPTTSSQKAVKIILDGIEDDRLHIYVGRDSPMMARINRAASSPPI